MKLTAAILSLLSLSAFTLAAPFPAPEGEETSTPAVPEAAAPTEALLSLPPPPSCGGGGTGPGTPGSVRPLAVSTYSVWSGRIQYATSRYRIFKNQISSDLTTLLTFNIPATAAGKKCTFNFRIPNTGTFTGSSSIDLFKSFQPATASASSWPPGNSRDQHYGRLQGIRNVISPYLAGYPTTGKSFNCPTGLTGFELVGTGDAVNVDFWANGVDGAWITWI